MIFFGGSQALAASCDSYVRVGFDVDLQKKAALMHPSPLPATKLCDPLPSSENENVRMTVEVAGRKIFERSLFVNLATYYDYLKHAGSTELRGGARPAQFAYFVTLLPERILNQKDAKIEFKSLEGDRVLAKWEGR